MIQTLGESLENNKCRPRFPTIVCHSETETHKVVGRINAVPPHNAGTGAEDRKCGCVLLLLSLMMFSLQTHQRSHVAQNLFYEYFCSNICLLPASEFIRKGLILSFFCSFDFLQLGRVCFKTQFWKNSPLWCHKNRPGQCGVDRISFLPLTPNDPLSTARPTHTSKWSSARRRNFQLLISALQLQCIESSWTP